MGNHYRLDCNSRGEACQAKAAGDECASAEGWGFTQQSGLKLVLQEASSRGAHFPLPHLSEHPRANRRDAISMNTMACLTERADIRKPHRCWLTPGLAGHSLKSSFRVYIVRANSICQLNNPVLWASGIHRMWPQYLEGGYAFSLGSRDRLRAESRKHFFTQSGEGERWVA